MEIAQRDALTVRALLEMRVRINAAPPGLRPNCREMFLRVLHEQSQVSDGELIQFNSTMLASVTQICLHLQGIDPKVKCPWMSHGEIKRRKVGNTDRGSETPGGLVVQGLL
jgi:hypothetical protein